MRRFLCAVALVLGSQVPAAALGPDDPAGLYYETCVASAQKAQAPDESCDRLLLDGLTGIIIGQFNQERPAFCLPRRLEEQLRANDDDRQARPGWPSEKASGALASLRTEMRTAVARYMRRHPERLAEKTLEVIFAALLQAYPCPG